MFTSIVLPFLDYLVFIIPFVHFLPTFVTNLFSSFYSTYNILLNCLGRSNITIQLQIEYKIFYYTVHLSSMANILFLLVIK